MPACVRRALGRDRDARPYPSTGWRHADALLATRRRSGNKYRLAASDATYRPPLARWPRRTARTSRAARFAPSRCTRM
ncbi:hypothetical protein WK24_14260 [Burkholderia vietnamiensis]|nr:hypothetical protein WK24_14260 [Burkholderia vietnamiensis]